VSRSVWASLALGLAAGLAAADVAVPKEGAPLEGSVQIRAKTGRLLCGDINRALDRFLLVENDKGVALWTPSFSDRMEGYKRLLARRRLPQLVELVKQALAARSAEVARRLFDRALEDGIEGRDRDVLGRRVRKLEAKPKPPRAKKLAAVLAAERALEAQWAGFLVVRARAHEGTVGLLILREALRSDPGHAGANKMLEAAVPDPAPFKSRDAWLDWSALVKPLGFRLVAAEHRELKKAQYRWRPDLFGIASSRILLLTPVRDPKVLFDCAIRAEATVRFLEEALKTDTPRKRPQGPLLLYLYGNRQNFEERVGYKGSFSVPPWNQWLYGRYSEKDDVTRLIGPAVGDKSPVSFEFVVGHEVTQHWLHARCPRFSSKETWDAHDAPGVWVRYGFPVMLGNAALDKTNARFDMASRDAMYLKTVRVALRQRGTAAWVRYFPLNVGDLVTISNKDPDAHNSAKLRKGVFFALQGAAACHYLYNADGGKHRTALFDYLSDHFAGRADKLEVKTRFGMSPTQLGRMVERHVNE